MAEAHYAQIAPHLYCGPVEGAANIQLAACSPNFLILESIESWDGFHAKILKKPIRWENGYVIPRQSRAWGRTRRGSRTRASLNGHRPPSRAEVSSRQRRRTKTFQRALAALPDRTNGEMSCRRWSHQKNACSASLLHRRQRPPSAAGDTLRADGSARAQGVSSQAVSRASRSCPRRFTVSSSQASKGSKRSSSPVTEMAQVVKADPAPDDGETLVAQGGQRLAELDMERGSRALRATASRPISAFGSTIRNGTKTPWSKPRSPSVATGRPAASTAA